MFEWLRKSLRSARTDVGEHQSDQFQGTPWGSELTEEWNLPSYWTSYYRELLADPDPWRREHVIHREISFLIERLTEVGELPVQSGRTFLDAGCGIALIPHIFALWGFEVTAIDSCPEAIELARRHQPNEEELARCLPIWESCKGSPYSFQKVDDPSRSLQKLQRLNRPGGSVSYLLADWFSCELQPSSFRIIYCRNSLRCSTKPYWRQSLQRFHQLMSPEGVLLIETVNAIAIMDEVNELLSECGFVPLRADTNRTPEHKYSMCMWPTG